MAHIWVVDKRTKPLRFFQTVDNPLFSVENLPQVWTKSLVWA